ncbi:MAG: DUF2911 domain-containing protein [Cyclobacteriaceae bacterium]|nr:DUF2911 domain-containing protein [Cyclobacteriaceae bacterium]
MKLIKKFSIALALFCLAIFTANAQVEMPSPSPTATISQKVGLTDVSIEYSRPSMKGRQIYGNLVPYGKIWRTGANMATKLTFGDDVKIAGKDLKAGTYALFTIPGEKEWTVIFNKNANQGGTADYKEEEDALRVTIPAINIAPTKVETFLINIEDMKASSAVIEIIWESTVVQVPLEVLVDERVVASIQKTLAGSPKAGDYFTAAVYYRENGKDLKQALTWINEAIKLNEASGTNAFWVYRQKSLIEADMKDYKSAIATAQIGLVKAVDARNDDYIKMNTESIAEWNKMK